MRSVNAVSQEGKRGDSEFGVFNFVEGELVKFLAFALDDFYLGVLVQEPVNVYFFITERWACVEKGEFLRPQVELAEVRREDLFLRELGMVELDTVLSLN